MQVIRDGIKLCTMCACIVVNDDWTSIDSFPKEQREPLYKKIKNYLSSNGNLVTEDIESTMIDDCECCDAEYTQTFTFAELGE